MIRSAIWRLAAEPSWWRAPSPSERCGALAGRRRPPARYSFPTPGTDRRTTRSGPGSLLQQFGENLNYIHLGSHIRTLYCSSSIAMMDPGVFLLRPDVQTTVSLWFELIGLRLCSLVMLILIIVIFLH